MTVMKERVRRPYAWRKAVAWPTTVAFTARRIAESMSVSRTALFIRREPSRPCPAALHDGLGDLVEQFGVVTHRPDRPHAGLGPGLLLHPSQIIAYGGG